MGRLLQSLLIATAACGLLWTGAHADDDDEKKSRKHELNVPASRGVRKSVTEAFFVTLDTDGEERTIAKAGPIEVFARCVVGDTDRIKILVTSSVAGWFESTSNTRFEANDLREIIDADAGGELVRYDGSPDKFSVIGPDEDDRVFYIAIDGETLGLGLNLLGHECIAVGTVTIAELRSNNYRRQWNRRRRADDDD